jgi:hypothetical protein
MTRGEIQLLTLRDKLNEFPDSIKEELVADGESLILKIKDVFKNDVFELKTDDKIVDTLLNRLNFYDTAMLHEIESYHKSVYKFLANPDYADKYFSPYNKRTLFSCKDKFSRMVVVKKIVVAAISGLIVLGGSAVSYKLLGY